MIDIEAALAEAMAAQRAGAPDLAASGFRTALAGLEALLAQGPPSPPLLGNRGFVLSQLGRAAEALDSYDQALALDPGFVDALYSRAVILLEQGRAAEALAGFGAVLARQPGHGGALGNRGQALLELARPAEALSSLEAARGGDPGNPQLAFRHGLALLRLGRRAAAFAELDAILAPWPEDAGARNELGNALKGEGEAAAAGRFYRRAIALAPGFAAALGNFGYALLAESKGDAALAACRRGLALEDSVDLRALFMKCLGAPISLLPNLRGPIGRALRETWGRPAAFASVGFGLLRAEGNPSEDVLLLALLESGPVFDPGLEARLTRLRRDALMRPSARDALGLPFLSALARQSFVNEYVFACDTAEAAEATRVRQSLADALAADLPVDPAALAVAAAYAPLTDLPLAERLPGRAWPPSIDALLTQQIREPEEERALAAAMPLLTPISGEVSAKVRGQYEQNPFPRWVRTAPGGRPTTLAAYLRQSFPFAAFDDAALGADLDILIAGCGTGQQSTETAQQFAHRDMLAIDLSRTSLAYAERKRREAGLGTLSYAQADILELGSLDRRFGLIESSGVLHHMADPFAGWRVLLSLLAPGGVMHLGFYSALARRWIVEARALIARRGHDDTADGIRAFRQEILAATDPLAATIRGSADFFSTSACRDLLFHVQEHRLTLPEIAAFLAENRLRLLGFDLPLEIFQRYRARFPADRAMTDLACWDAFEIENPDTFLGMYQFWVQKA